MREKLIGDDRRSRLAGFVAYTILREAFEDDLPEDSIFSNYQMFVDSVNSINADANELVSQLASGLEEGMPRAPSYFAWSALQSRDNFLSASLVRCLLAEDEAQIFSTLAWDKHQKNLEEAQALFHLLGTQCNLLATKKVYSVEESLSVALRKMAAVGDLQAVKHLIAYGADPRAADTTAGKNALHRAAESGNNKLYLFLLEQCSEASLTKDYAGNLPAHYLPVKGSEGDKSFCSEVRRLLIGEDRRSQVTAFIVYKALNTALKNKVNEDSILKISFSGFFEKINHFFEEMYAFRLDSSSFSLSGEEVMTTFNGYMNLVSSQDPEMLKAFGLLWDLIPHEYEAAIASFQDEGYQDEFERMEQLVALVGEECRLFYSKKALSVEDSLDIALRRVVNAKKDISKVRELVESGANPASQDGGEKGLTAFHYAAKVGYVEAAEYLLRVCPEGAKTQDKAGKLPCEYLSSVLGGSSALHRRCDPPARSGGGISLDSQFRQ
jgi:hypothetical protein